MKKFLSDKVIMILSNVFVLFLLLFLVIKILFF